MYMREELEKKLRENFTFLGGHPGFDEQLEMNRRPSIFDLFGAYGCECGDGWYNVIYELCEGIESAFNRYKIDRSIIVVDQIKEKMGTLRFYYHYETDNTDDAFIQFAGEVKDLISQAERKSGVTCERCGRPGILRQGGWIMCLCDDCRRKPKDEEKDKEE